METSKLSWPFVWKVHSLLVFDSAPICPLPGADGRSMTLHLARKYSLDTPILLLCVSVWEVRSVPEYLYSFFKTCSGLYPTYSLFEMNVSVVTERIVYFWLEAFMCFHLSIIFKWIIICHWCSFVVSLNHTTHKLSQSTINIHVMTHSLCSTSSCLKLCNGELKPTQTMSCMCCSMPR